MTSPYSKALARLTCILAAAGMAVSAFSQTPAADYGKLPLSFEANQGQAVPAVRFQSRGAGYALAFTDRAAILSLDKRGPGKTHTSDTLRLQLTHAAPSLAVRGAEPLPGTANYFLGNDPAQWHTGIPTFARVEYAAVYPGIDLVYHGNQRQLEYDFVLAPGADPKKIQLHFAGARSLQLSPGGDLRILASNGEVVFHQPIVYQTSASNQRQPVEGRFKLLANNTIAFQLGRYDHARQLTIDPTLIYSTYLGSTGSDSAQAVAVDPSGNAYVTGYTYSANFPTTSSAYQKTSTYTSSTNLSAVFVSKLNPAGTALVYSTYLAGTTDHCNDGINYNATTQGDFGDAIAVDASGSAYITGGTCSSNFPTSSGAFQTTAPGVPHHATNVFITKLNPAGNGLGYSTYLGGSGVTYSGDFAFGIAIDPSGNGDAYVTGQTSSTDFPTTKGAFQTVIPNTAGRNSAFVSKMNATGTALVYSTYLGGSGNGSDPSDSGQAIAINASGDAYITGYTYSSNFPVTKGVFQTSNKAYAASGSNAFVTELNSTGSALVFSTYLGGASNSSDANYDSGNGIALDSSGNVYIGGGTSSANFPVTSGAYQTKNKNTENGANAVVTKLNPTGTKLVYSTYVGGTGHANCGGDRAYALAIDGVGDAYFTGYTCSNNFPTTSGAYQTSNKGYANTSEVAYLTELNPAGTGLLYSTYIGGSGTTANPSGDSGNAIAYSNGNVYIAGATESKDFPVTSSAYQKTLKATPAGNTNAFVTRFAFATATTTSLVTDGTPQKLGVKVTFTADVSGTSGSGTPAGKVDFSIDGGTAIASTLDDTGHAAYSTTALAAGVHSITASYLGDATHLASTSAKLSQTIYGPVATLTVVSGSGQSGPINVAYKLPLVVLAKDSAGDLVPAAVVSWSGTGLKFSASTSTTGSNGEASITATPATTGSLKAAATSNGKSTTFTLTATSGQVAEPTVTQTITIAEATSGATVYYTTNGSTPTTSSTKYTGPITLTSSETLKFIAIQTGSTSSTVRTVTDTIQ